MTSDWIYVCPGDRVVFDTCDPITVYGTSASNYPVFYSYYSGYQYPSYTLTTCTTEYGYQGFNVEIINEMSNCGYIYLNYDCSWNSYTGSYCGGELTSKAFYEFTGQYEPYIFKPEENQYSYDMCYDQSQYFCGSTSCLTPVANNGTWSWSWYCTYQFNGFGAACPQNATCSGGKYVCDPGFKDAFHLDHFIADPNDCTACQTPRGCVPDDAIYPPTDAVTTIFPYSLNNSYSNIVNYVEVSIGNVCDKNFTVNGCTDDQFGDQYMQVANSYDYAYFSNDDVHAWRLCSRIQPQWSMAWGCNDTTLRLGCFGTSHCGGSVEVTVGSPCLAATYSKNGFTPCLPCPAGLTSRMGQTQCSRCADGYIGFNGTAPCVQCPAGTVEYQHSSCEVCNPDTLFGMPDDLYDVCLTYLLNKIPILEQRVDALVATFEQYLIDSKYGMPTVHPTAMPTRRRRSRAPTSGM
jgi:hypothetical protein